MVRDLGINIHFRYCNESLLGIVNGLDIGSGDRVLSVCGSGDQPFALVEKADYVLGLDSDMRQVRYAQKRANYIKQGRYNDIFKLKSRFLDNSMKYFSRERLDRIGDRLNRVEIREGDLLSREVDCFKFNKVYLSNICSFRGQEENASNWFRDSAGNLPENSLVFMALFSYGLGIEIPNYFEIDSFLTEKARVDFDRDMCWDPVVFRKVV